MTIGPGVRRKLLFVAVHGLTDQDLSGGGGAVDRHVCRYYRNAPPVHLAVGFIGEVILVAAPHLSSVIEKYARSG